MLKFRSWGLVYSVMRRFFRNVLAGRRGSRTQAEACATNFGRASRAGRRRILSRPMKTGPHPDGWSLNARPLPMFVAFLLAAGAFTPAAAQGPAQPTQPVTARPAVPSGGITQTPQGFQGSAVSGSASAAPVALSLQDAIDRGLKNNLGLLVSDTANQQAHAERVRALSALLPVVTGCISETSEQLNLATFGFHFPGVPNVVGPFHYTDARAFASQSFDLTSLRNRRSAILTERAAQLSVQDARDLVVQAVATAYLQIIADQARIDATRAQVTTAQALFERARDQHRAGVSPAIDELRAQVEWKTLQQQSIAQENQVAKDKLALGRVIGLPPAQAFSISDAIPYAPLEGIAPEDVLKRALESRSDYKSAAMQVRAAETAREAARAERLPTLAVDANYGDLGTSLANSHGTFAVTGSLKFNIFTGGRTRADVEQADAVIQQRKDQLADLQGQIDVEIRNALLDLKTAADQVAVARDNVDLAGQTLVQARDRFVAGVTDNIEVVQAQESVANANQTLISSIYMHNLAKVQLARAAGMTETNLKQYMGGGSGGR
jgi:outer membrane protein TolC